VFFFHPPIPHRKKFQFDLRPVQLTHFVCAYQTVGHPIASLPLQLPMWSFSSRLPKKCNEAGRTFRQDIGAENLKELCKRGHALVSILLQRNQPEFYNTDFGRAFFLRASSPIFIEKIFY